VALKVLISVVSGFLDESFDLAAEMHHNELEFEATYNPLISLPPLISIPESSSFHLTDRDEDAMSAMEDAESKRSGSANAAIEIFSYPENKTVCELRFLPLLSFVCAPRLMACSNGLVSSSSFQTGGCSSARHGRIQTGSANSSCRWASRSR
jgi:hypothetical protein